MYFNSKVIGMAQKTNIKNILAYRRTQNNTVNGQNLLYDKNSRNTT